jgi:transposase
MSAKKIYSNELKLEIVQRYLKGNVSFSYLAKEYHVNKSDVIKWKAAYEEHGIDGLTTKNVTYNGDFKVSVIEYIQSTGTSMRQTAAHFNIPCSSTITKWKHIYDKEGIEALYEEKRGRAIKMGNKKVKEIKSTIETDKNLLAEIQRLRMENEYLKKLNALIQEREESEKQIK